MRIVFAEDNYLVREGTGALLATVDGLELVLPYVTSRSAAWNCANVAVAPADVSVRVPEATSKPPVGCCIARATKTWPVPASTFSALA